MAKKSKAALKRAKLKEAILDEFKQQQALDRFREEKPQLWMQSQRVSKLVDIQGQLDDNVFPEGSCFLHANTVTSHSFCVKRITGIDLDTCQVTMEIYGDEELEGGIVVLPLETIEWFGFPAKAVPIGVHFEGFVTKPHHEAKPEGETDHDAAKARGPSAVLGRHGNIIPPHGRARR